MLQAIDSDDDLPVSSPFHPRHRTKQPLASPGEVEIELKPVLSSSNRLSPTSQLSFTSTCSDGENRHRSRSAYTLPIPYDYSDETDCVPSLSGSSRTSSFTVSNYSSFALPVSRFALTCNFLGLTLDESDGKLRDRYGFEVESDFYDLTQYLDFAKRYEQTLALRNITWEKLITDNFPKLPKPSKEVKEVIRLGIPSSLRGQCWFYYSGAEKRYKEAASQYPYLLSQFSKAAQENLEAIDKDLYRTFPENGRFKTARDDASIHAPLDGCLSQSPSKLYPDLIGKLRRVLVCFSLQRPDIGYCQSLNYIAALGLLFMPEDHVFWLMVVLVEDIMPPDIYSRDLLGTTIDQDIFRSLLETKFPTLHQHAAALDTPLSLMTCQWFLTLFINNLPVETVLRIWDCLFYEGSKILFRVALAIFKMHEQDYLASLDSVSLMNKIRNLPKAMLDCDQLMKTAFYGIGSLPMSLIDRKREYFRRRWFSTPKNLSAEAMAVQFCI